MAQPSVTVPALLAGVVVVAYANSFQGVFQFDDYNVIVDSAQVHSWDGWLGSLHNGLRPLLKLSYLLNWTAGTGLFGFHLLNLLTHVANAYLVYALALLFGDRVAPERDWRWPAFAAALLFAVHPVHSEAVTYVSGRSSSLMTLFYLAALWAYARGAATKRCGGYTLLSLGLFALALLVKESAMMFPLALLVWEWACRTPLRTIATRQWPFWVLSALGMLVLLLHPRYGTLMRESVQMLTLYDGFLTQLHGAGVLLGHLLWPVALNIDPDLTPVHEAGAVLPQLACFLLLFAAAWRLRISRPWISLGLAWAMLHLMLPNAVFARVDIANERQLYWADWALFLMLAVELDHWLARRQAWAVILAVVAALAFLTVERNRVYRSEIALWQDTVVKSPQKARAYNNLGYAYQLAGRDAEAEMAYRRALALQPGYIKAARNLLALRGDGTAAQGNQRRDAIPPRSH